MFFQLIRKIAKDIEIQINNIIDHINLQDCATRFIRPIEMANVL